MNRGARHRPIYLDDRDRRRFLGLLEDLDREEGIETHAYCLMGNHYHLVLFCPEGNLSPGMHHLGSTYAQRFNRRHGFDGSVFRGRFRSKQIETDQYLLQASRYVHRNPLDLNDGVDLATYRWSSYGAYLGHRRSPTWLRRSVVLDLAGGEARYRAYVDSGAPAPPAVEDSSNARAMDAIEAVVVRSANRAPGVLTGRGSHTIVRNLALVLAVESGRATIEDLAGRYGVGTSSVWSAVHRTRSRLRADADLASVVEACRTDLATTDRSETSKRGA